MVSREVGEKRDIERDAVDATLVEPVRRNLHHDRLGARGLERGEHLMQPCGVGRRVGCGRKRAQHAVAQRAQDCGLSARGLETRRNPMRARGLAVCAGDADHPQVARRMAEDEVGDRSKPGLEIFQRQVRNLPDVIPVEAVGFPQNRARAARDRIADERSPVVMRPGVRRECVAGMKITAVRRDAPHRGPEPREQRGNIQVRRNSAAHVSSRTSPPSGGNTTLSSGASAGTPRSRNAAPMMVLNTGAATVPP